MTLGYIALNSRVTANDDLEGKWNEAIVAYFKSQLLYFTGYRG